MNKVKIVDKNILTRLRKEHSNSIIIGVLYSIFTGCSYRLQYIGGNPFDIFTPSFGQRY